MSDEFTDDEKTGFYKAIYSRRDVRSHFTQEPIGDKTLTKILHAAHHAPSVGFSQPWNFVLIKDTKKRIRDLRAGIGSMKYAPIAFGILSVYVLFAFEYVDQIPILNWSWLGYNIAFGPLAEQGMLGIIPFVPFLRW